MNVKEAIKSLEEWLEHPNELAKKPYKIVYTNEFMDEDDIECLIFKYKESLFDTWKIAIVSESGILSEKTPYQKSTEIDEAFRLLNILKSYWKKKAKEYAFQNAFERNLKYISSTSLDVKTIENQFVKTASRYCLQIGSIDCPSGKIVVGDPLAYLVSSKYSFCLEKTIPANTYPVEVSIYKDETIGIRMCSARIKVTTHKAVKYEHANFENSKFAGFPVDAGMMGFMDEEVAKAYQEYIDVWYQNNPDGNHYDDLFYDVFAQSYKTLPAYQREGGDFIEWEVPEKKGRLVMVASGFGDGFYPCFWGYDANDEICELLVPLINPDLFE